MCLYAWSPRPYPQPRVLLGAVEVRGLVGDGAAAASGDVAAAAGRASADRAGKREPPRGCRAQRQPLCCGAAGELLGHAACLGAGGTGTRRAEVWRCCAQRDACDPSCDGFLLERSGCSARVHLLIQERSPVTELRGAFLIQERSPACSCVCVLVRWHRDVLKQKSLLNKHAQLQLASVSVTHACGSLTLA